MKLLILSVSMLLTSCHPLSIFGPKAIKNKTNYAGKAISIAIDKHGSPYIKAADTHGVVYGLGFMHARDRLFQLDMSRHAALGRLAELFGEKALSHDRQLRLLSFKLEEQLALLDREEQEIINAYVKGVNDGARQRGRSAEHFLLGLEFEALRPVEVIAMARLQAWVLGGDLMAELGRLKLARSELDIKAKEALLSPIDDRESAIIKLDSPRKISSPLIFPDYLSQKSEALHDNQALFLSSEGASNAWVVSDKLSASNKALLMNDPHLRHSWPSNFYAASLESSDMKISGVSIVGLPSIVIGASPYLAWGVTAAYTNTQDAVMLRSDTQDPEVYWVSNKALRLEPWSQTFCLNKKQKWQKQLFYTSIFGPVIDKDFDKSLGARDKIAIQWTAFLTHHHKHLVMPFIDLARAKNLEEAIKIVNSMSLPAVNLVLADTKQNIGYAYAGLIPLRDKDQPALLPLDGSKISSLWQGLLPASQKPQLINPDQGYIITANQNIFSSQASPDLSYGKQGSSPYRALQIKRRFEEFLAKNNKLNFEDLASIQLDTMSLEAHELSSKIGSVCSKVFRGHNSSRQEFAELLSNFDGKFSTESKAALPFVMFMQELGEKRFASKNINYQLNYLVSEDLNKKFNAQENLLFADNNFERFLSSVCEPAYERVVKHAGSAPWKWRWGRHHYLERQSPLAKAPLIGRFFRDKRREIGGHSSSPLAESGLPVAHGANVRFLATMSDPPEISLVIDSGNSGVVGHRNAFDQAALWHEGKTITLSPNWDHALKNAVESFELGN